MYDIDMAMRTSIRPKPFFLSNVNILTLKKKAMTLNLLGPLLSLSLREITLGCKLLAPNLDLNFVRFQQNSEKSLDLVFADLRRQ